MQHPFLALSNEYSNLLSIVKVRSECQRLVSSVVARLLTYQANGHYAAVSKATGVPEIWMAASFEREASSDFRLSPAQGDPWDTVSVHVPSKRGPFPDWASAAKDAYHLDGLDAIGATNWTWERACFEGELFNGFGYRDFHRMHSPYLWGATNVQQPGKYTSDGKFDSETLDSQIGMVPIMLGMVLAKPELALANPVPVPLIPPPHLAPVGVGGSSGAVEGPLWIQQRLNIWGAAPQVALDGSYGRLTQQAVRAFQAAHGLEADSFVGPKTIAALMLTPEVQKESTHA